jgi:DNA helicase HerA-like ATPase
VFCMSLIWPPRSSLGVSLTLLGVGDRRDPLAVKPYDPQFRLAIRDPKTNALLWAFTERVQWAILLAVLETDNSTPYYLNLHTGDVAHTLILGISGSGKSYFCNFLLQNAQKYAPLTFIFDIGGSFQSLTTIFGGSYLNVGQEARDFTINPFSLSQTKDNLQFLFSFFRVEPNQRTISNFTNIIGELKERLHRARRPFVSLKIHATRDSPQIRSMSNLMAQQECLFLDPKALKCWVNW